MASITTVAKAEALRLALTKAFGVSPEIEYKDTYAKVYWSGDNLKKVQKIIKKKAAAEPGDVQIDLVQPMLPTVLQKTWPLMAGLVLAGYMLGRR